VNCPATTQTGDFLGIWFVANDNLAPTPPSGYINLISGGDLDGNGVFFYYHIQQDGDPTSVTFDYSETVSLSALCAAYSGVNTTDPIDGTPSAMANEVSTTITSPSITTSIPTDTLLMLYNVNTSTDTVSSPSFGTLEQQERFGGEVLAWVDQPLAAAGVTGDQSVQIATPEDSFNAQVALAPGTSCDPPTPLSAIETSLSTHTLDFGAIKVGKVRKLSFTIKNTGKTMLHGNVDTSALPSPLSVTAGAGSFSLGRNQVHHVTVEAASTKKGPFLGIIKVDLGDPMQRTVKVTAKGRGME